MEEEKKVRETPEQREQRLRNFFKDRVTQLRLRRNISEMRMSRELGKSRSYVWHLSSGNTLPGMAQFFRLCDYFDVEPWEFFAPTQEISDRVLRLSHTVDALSEEEFAAVERMIDLFLQAKRPNKPR